MTTFLRATANYSSIGEEKTTTNREKVLIK